MILQADARAIPLRDGCVQCVVTSPPYWGLRDYGISDQLGLESSPHAYVESLVAVFREVWRVLKDDGVCWLNLGDSYATGAGKVGECPGGGAQGERWKQRADFYGGHRGSRGGSSKRPHTGASVGPMTQPNRMPIDGLKPKDLVGIPWRVAFALQADGWYLRSDIIWSKPNPMPESVTDRPTKAHEYLFLLTKRERYYYDAAAIAEDAIDPEFRRGMNRSVATDALLESRDKGYDGHRTRMGLRAFKTSGKGGLTRNRRSVWTVNTSSYPDAHFATFPEKLVEPCILAGSRPGDLVLDPFGGSGTTGRVAISLGRRAVVMDLNPKYLEMARRRMQVTRGLPLEVSA